MMRNVFSRVSEQQVLDEVSRVEQALATGNLLLRLDETTGNAPTRAVMAAFKQLRDLQRRHHGPIAPQLDDVDDFAGWKSRSSHDPPQTCRKKGCAAGPAAGGNLGLFG